MPGQGHDALDLRVPVDVVSPAATRQEPSVCQYNFMLVLLASPFVVVHPSYTPK